MAKIVYDKKACIGAGECEALSKELWHMGSDSKAILKGAVLNPKTGKYELAIDDSQIKLHERIAGSCPVGAIKVEK